MARNRRKGGGCLSRLLLVTVVIMALYIIAMHARSYVDDQQVLQHFVDTHATTAPATAGH